MPSWNIHTAHVERLLSDQGAGRLGIADADIFLFGNYVPDIYLGFMVADTTYRLDYCLTHLAVPNVIPLPDADRFWDESIYHAIRKAATPEGEALALGAWAHLAADRAYNSQFRKFCLAHEVPAGDELRVRKQHDFALFGRSLEISSHVKVTAALLAAAHSFRPYSILEDDVRRAVQVASAITREGGVKASADDYRLLGADWLNRAFEDCNRFLASWLLAWRELAESDAPCTAAAIRAQAGLPPAAPIDADWLSKVRTTTA